MGYSPKHAKPASLRGTALKPPHAGGASSGHGRHRAGAQIPAPRIPGDASVPAGPGPVSGPGAIPEIGPAAEAPEAAAADTASARNSQDAAADQQAARAESLMNLIPLQRAPLADS